MRKKKKYIYLARDFLAQLVFLGVVHKNFGKVPVPHVVPMVEESITASRRPHAWTVRPHQWHIARGGPTIEKKLRRGG